MALRDEVAVQRAATQALRALESEARIGPSFSQRSVPQTANGVTTNPASDAELMEVQSVRLTLGHRGDWFVDPRELAARLDVRVSDLKRMTRRGQVDAKLATGDGDDMGLSRVTVRLPDRGWSGIFDQGGMLISEEAW
ncbi:DUF6522 family protein (plasmid) [Methylobacterium sp. NMS12]|uniref:DUF6522 family protein n=1 Tax=Methylobacterium sp. NMS12 TaxID=3079766 RepID=UPI003F88586C